MVEELADYRRLGGRSIVDVTPVSIGRDVVRVQNLSKVTGLNIVVGSAHYIAPLQSAWVRDASGDEIAGWFPVEVTEGIDGTGIRPGIHGVLGVSMSMEPSEERVLRAAARVSSETGIPISLHAFLDVAIQALDVLEDAGADLTRVVVGHCDGFLDGEESVAFIGTCQARVLPGLRHVRR